MQGCKQCRSLVRASLDGDVDIGMRFQPLSIADERLPLFHTQVCAVKVEANVFDRRFHFLLLGRRR